MTNAVPNGLTALLRTRLTWSPIEGCPGRETLASGLSELNPAQLVASVAGRPELAELFVVEHRRSAKARDELHILRFDDGGLLSYAKTDIHASTRFLHTLNTPEGLARKLAQLGLDG